MCLCQQIAQSQFDAALLPTSDLRSAIQYSLDVLDAVIGNFEHLHANAPLNGAGDVLLLAAQDLVLASALTTALYVRELTARPASCFEYVDHSLN